MRFGKQLFQRLRQRRREQRRRARQQGLRLRVEGLEQRRLLTAEAFSDVVDFSALQVDRAAYDDSQFLVQFASEEAARRAAAVSNLEFSGSVDILPGLRTIKLPEGVDFTQTLDAFRRDDNVAVAEPDYAVYVDATPNDPKYGQLWGINRINAAAAWDTTVGSTSTVMAVIDSGVDYRHQDLAHNIWLNEDEIPSEIRGRLTDTNNDGVISFHDLNQTVNQGLGKIDDHNNNGYIDGGDLFADELWTDGVDTDGNNFVDDFVGYDFRSGDNDPADDHSHGTHVAGTMAAVGNNGIGVVGVNWQSQIMALKFIGSNGSGSTSAAIASLNYAVANGATISNNSWGGGGSSSSLSNAIENARSADHIFVAAAGNNGRNTDASPFYPASFPHDNIVSVAATTSSNARASYSNYGLTSVDVGAPGSGITSTVPNNGYGGKSGTSMASPHVAGLVGLMRSQHPDWDYREILTWVYDTVAPFPALEGKSVTEGLINAQAAIAGPSTLVPRFDFGTPTSPVADGYTKVTQHTIYSDHWGYGWQSGEILDANRSIGDELGQDLNLSPNAVFAADMANGTYDAIIRLGDRGVIAHDQIKVYLEGQLVDTVSTSIGQVVAVSHKVAIQDGTFNLRIEDGGGSDPNAAIVSLDLLPESSGPFVMDSQVLNAAGGEINGFVLEFQEPIAASSFSIADDLVLQGPDGTIAISSLDPISTSRYAVRFAEQSSEGAYQLSVGPGLEDLSGNTMNQDGDGVNGEATEDEYVASFVLSPAINFNDYAIGSYGGGGQDATGSFAIEDGGLTLRMTGNVWKKIDFSYTVTPQTVLEFDFSSSSQGEVHGTGFDTDLQLSEDRTFALYGTQAWGLPDFRTYSGSAPNVVRYRIPVGDFFTGQFEYLVFAMDHDVANPTGENVFSDVRLLETNNSPVITTSSGNVGYQENAAAVVIDDALQITDPDSAVFDSGQLRVRLSAGGTANDRLELRHEGDGAGQVGVVGANVSYGGVVVGTLTGGGAAPLLVALNAQATVAAVQAIGRNVTYVNVSEDPSTANRLVEFVAEDGTGGVSVPATRVVSVGAVNDPPVITTSSGNVGYQENAAAVVIDEALQIMDPDSAVFDSGQLRVRLSAGGTANDRLELRHQGDGAGQVGVVGANVSYGGIVVGTLTGGGASPLLVALNAQATLAAVQAIGRNVTYVNVTEDPSTTDRLVEFVAEDGTGGVSVPATRVVSVGAVNDPPVITTSSGNVGYQENAAAVVIDEALQIMDPDSAVFDSGQLRVRLSAGGTANDRLELRHQGDGAGQVGVVGANVSYGGIVVGTLTGGGASPLLVALNAQATLAAVQAIGRNVTYVNVTEDPSTTDRLVEFVAEDGTGGVSVPATRVVSVGAVNDPPVITTSSGNVGYQENAAAVVIDDALQIMDPDSAVFDSGQLRVRLSAGGTANDRLELRHEGDGAGQVGVVGANVSYGGVVVGTLTGGGASPLLVALNAQATLAAVQAIGRNVTYVNVSEDPSTVDRLVEFVAEDGTGGVSVPATRVVSVGAVNDPLVLEVNAEATVTSGGTVVVGNANLKLSDVDNAASELAYELVTVPARGTLRRGDVALGVGASFSQQDVNVGLLSYEHDGTAGASDGFVFRASDGSGGSVPDTQFNIRIAAAIDFNDYTIDSYGGSEQDVTGAFAIEDGGRTLRMTGNLWKKIDFNYTVTPETVLEFDFSSSSQGEVHGIGLDTDLQLSEDRAFALYGTQSWGLGAFRTYSGSAPNVAHYRIPLGEFYTGQFEYLVFAMDHDVASPTGESVFSNVQLFENRPPVITTSGGVVGYQENAAAVVIDDALQITDPDSAVFDSGQLSIRLAAGGTANDRLELRHEGDGAGQVGVVGANVSYGGVVVGTLTGGGASPLLVALNAQATLAAVQAIGRNVTYVNVSEDPSTVDRLVEFVAEDGTGGVSVPATRVVSVGAVNDPLVLEVNAEATVTSGGTVVVGNANLKLSDVDNAASELAYELVTVPARGTLRRGDVALGVGASFSQQDVNVGLLSYEHDGTAGASDGFVFRASDGSGGSVPDTQFNIRIAAAIDFNDYTIDSYGGSEQDVTGAFAIEDGGRTLRMTGNLWKKIDFNYTVTPETVLEFDFSSSSQGEVHGIGLDTDLQLSEDRTFSLYGTQSWGLGDFRTYSGSAPNVAHYRIPVGEFFTGQFSYLVFAMDHDVANPSGESVFSDVNVFDS